jgi:hypothetical protein
MNIHSNSNKSEAIKSDGETKKMVISTYPHKYTADCINISNLVKGHKMFNEKD